MTNRDAKVETASDEANAPQSEQQQPSGANKKAILERLAKPAEDKRGITIGPTTATGPDIVIDAG